MSSIQPSELKDSVSLLEALDQENYQENQSIITEKWQSILYKALADNLRDYSYGTDQRERLVSLPKGLDFLI